MTAFLRTISILGASAGLLFGLSGCVSGGSDSVPAMKMRVDPQGLVAGTGFEAIDLVVACNTMQHAMISLHAMGQVRGAVDLAVEPVVNKTPVAVNEIAFNEAIFRQLAYDAPRPWRLQKADPAVAVDFYLAGRLQRLMPAQPGDAIMLLYSFQLIDAHNSEIVWEGTAELRNRVLLSAAQR